VSARRSKFSDLPNFGKKTARLGARRFRLQRTSPPRVIYPVHWKEDGMTTSQGFAQAANIVAHFAGRPMTFLLCCAIVIIWALTGPLFGYSDTWQLIINTGTTIITFLMVFLIQNTQNRDSVAIQTKLDELIRTSAAQNAFVGIEKLTEEELEEIRLKCEARAKKEAIGEKAERKVRQVREKAARAVADEQD
jgi:low affinity Fe/Cu permease